ncbi:EAL domain-containing protein [Agrobacterium tumefaciens]|uniref:EAL domain-containing protein n=1 Tax=Agrobacterium cavarae TaxID=2528239 RepID=UPI000DE13AB0|nr:EAL domain-containing protein [Agrobacterium cavarae]MQB22756.1 EAL domain-containing protein [Agrobacterium tumefaciens]
MIFPWKQNRRTKGRAAKPASASREDRYRDPEISAKSLQSALLGGEIWPAFQPIVDLQSGAIVGFEILARWTHPVLGAIPPAVFIPLAEQGGLIGDLTEMILGTACVSATDWEGSFVLAVNLSAVQFDDPELSTKILRTVRSSGFPINRLHIEITESALLENDPRVHSTIASLKASGVGLALDDFGTGFASLTQLHAFPFNKLKIDMSFVRSMTVDSGSRKIIASVVGLGQSLGMTVVAEGVETEEQAGLLRRMGCDLGQGWLFGKAQNALETSKLIGNRLFRDLSKRAVPAQLFQRVHQLDALYTAAPIGLCLLDTDLVHRSVNPRFSAMFGLSPDDMLGQTVDSFMPAQEAAKVSNDLRRVLGGETVIVEEYRPAGSDKIFFVINQRVDDDDGVPIGISVSAVDVTGHKAVETRLSQTEDHQRWSIDLSPNIPWASDAAGTVNFMGPTPDSSKIDVKARIDDWMARMHPDDRPRVRLQWLEWIPSGKPFETIFRMRLGDDGFHWMLSRAKPHHGPDGTISKWYGVITEVAAQQSLREQVLRLQSVGTLLQQHSHEGTPVRAQDYYIQPLQSSGETDQYSQPSDGLSRSHYLSMLMRMFEGAPIAMSITTSDTKTSRYVKVNSAYLKMIGRSWEEIGGKTLLAAGSAIDNPARNRRHQLLLEQGYYELEEVDIVRGDGTTVPTLISAQRTTINGTSFDLEIIVDVSERMRQQREAENALKVSARTDALSGLPNRAYFDEQLPHRIETARGPQSGLAIAYMDLNGFKEINDTLGHPVGDEVLRVISSRLRSEFLPHFIARVGGDEFALLIETDRSCAVGLQQMVESRIHNIFKSISLNGRAIMSGAAVGVTTLNHRDDAHSLVKRADDFMYAAKSTGQRIAFVYDSNQKFEGDRERVSGAA